MGEIYTVSRVNSYVKNLLGRDVLLRDIDVRGELSNVSYNRSGHIYFTLKDNSAAISSIMYSTHALALKFRLKDGMKVVVSGGIGLYEKSGTYQLYAAKIRLEGSGLLYEQYLQLKAELEERGLFDEGYKQEIPAYITRLGVVTASTGAAVRDIINISKRRNPFIEIILYPAKVQGEGAAETIVEGIRALDKYGVDTIIVGRGGGSIEDLWAFNEEITAQAIFDCSTPIISAVGHETDTTIADFAADLRAPTPSAAAELAVFAYSDFENRLGTCRMDIRSAMSDRIKNERQKLENLSLKIKNKSPANQINERLMRLDSLRDNISGTMKQRLQKDRTRIESLSIRLKGISPERRIRERRIRLERINEKLKNSMSSKLQNYKAKMALYEEKMRGEDPDKRLKSGYAFVEDAKGKPVRDVETLKEGDSLKLIMKNGRIYSDVRKIERKQNEH